MGTKSRETIYGSSIRASAERAEEARKEADRLACVAWNQRMLGYKGRAQPSPALGDALNAVYCYLEVRCLGCDTHQTVALDIVRRPKTTPIHELERYMRCKDCSQIRGHPYKRSHLVALRPTKIPQLIRRRRGGRANADVQPLQHHHQLGRNHCAVPRDKPLRRQPCADARRVSGLSGACRAQYRSRDRNDDDALGHAATAAHRRAAGYQ